MELKDNVIMRLETSTNGEARICQLQRGDVFYISARAPLQLGSQFMGYPAYVTKIHYKPRKWWMFWKKKEAIGYEVMWRGGYDDEKKVL